MGTKLNKTETDVLLKADEDLFNKGHTEIKCPRCGNEIVCEEQGNSYTIKCKTPNCIETGFRGI